MVKQTKRFKKGGMAKKVLSAILAASMVMTSSCLAFAAPVEEPVAVVEEDAVTVGTEGAPVEEESATEDLQGRAEVIIAPTVVVNDNKPLVFNGTEQRPKVEVKDGTTILDSKEYTLEYGGDWTNAGEEGDAYLLITFDGGKYSGTTQIKKLVQIKKASLANAEVTIDDVDTFVYDGTAKMPEMSVKVDLDGVDGNEYTLDEDEYSFDVNAGTLQKPNLVEEAINAGSYRVRATATANGNFEGSVEGEEKVAKFSIEKAELSDKLVSAQVGEIKYDGSAVTSTDLKKAIALTDINQNLPLEDDDFTFVADDDAKSGQLGTHTATITPKSAANYEGGKLVVEYTVVQNNSLSGMLKDVKVDEDDGLVYDNDEDTDQYTAAVAAAKAKIKAAGIKDGEYEIVTEAADWNNAGTYELEVKGLQIYAGQTATIPVVVAPKTLDQNMVTAVAGKHSQSGNLSEPTVVITDGKEVLTEGEDYIYEIVKEKGVTCAVITGIGNYTTKIAKDETIKVLVTKDTYLPLSDSSITVTVKDLMVGEKPQAKDFVLTEKDGSNTITLKPGVDFYIKNSDVDEAGKGTVTLAAKTQGIPEWTRKYSGERVVEVNVVGTSFADTYTATMEEEFSVDDNVTVADVKKTIKVSPKGSTGTTQKWEEKYYDADGKEITGPTTKLEAGEYTVRIESTLAQYEGYIELSFRVVGENAAERVEIADIADQVYNGSAIEPKVTLVAKDADDRTDVNFAKDLVEGEDYTVSYKDNVNANIAKVIVTFIGEYSGELTESFTIVKADQTVTLDERQAGKNGLLNRTTGDKNCTMRLKLDVPDKQAKYTFESSNPEVAEVSAKGVISYQSVGTATIKITVTSPNTEDAVLEQTVNVTKLGKASFTPTVTTRTPAKSFTVTSNTVKGAEGWQVRFSRFENMKSATTKNFVGYGKKLSRQTLTAKWADMEYYVQVRPYYLNAGGEKVFSNWSATKTIVSAATK